MVFLFFFSSRRRHTRFDCDWSSDVCSSDLLITADTNEGSEAALPPPGPAPGGIVTCSTPRVGPTCFQLTLSKVYAELSTGRMLSMKHATMMRISFRLTSADAPTQTKCITWLIVCPSILPLNRTSQMELSAAVTAMLILLCCGENKSDVAGSPSGLQRR